MTGSHLPVEANEKMKSFILSGDHKSLIGYKTMGRTFSPAKPTPEHLLPLLYILASEEESDEMTLFKDIPVMEYLTMTSVKFFNPDKEAMEIPE